MVARKYSLGASFKKSDYIDLLSLLYFLVRLATTKGNMALEPHIEKPEESPAFQKFPRVIRQPLRLLDDLRLPADVGDERRRPQPDRRRDGARAEENAERRIARRDMFLQSMADGLPALGIVAAVLGVIKTMSHIDRPPAVLGGMIASALCGTFLGVLLAYGLRGRVRHG